MKQMIKVVVTALAGLLLVTACSTIMPGKKVDYKKSKTTEPLEVPPDLTATSINEAPDLPNAAGTSYSEISKTEPAAGTPTVLPVESKVMRFVELSRELAKFADPDWETEMKEYLDLVDNLYEALKKGQMELFLHILSDLKTLVRTCHRENR